MSDGQILEWFAIVCTVILRAPKGRNAKKDKVKNYWESIPIHDKNARYSRD